jgi:hypothetical protein
VVPVAKSTTTRSGYTCATVTISQAAFMQPSTAKERHHSFPFTATYPTVRITSGAAAQLYPCGTDGNCLTCSNQRAGEEVPTNFAHAGVVTGSHATTNNH